MNLILLFIIWLVFKAVFKHIGNIQKQQQNRYHPAKQVDKKTGQPVTVNDWLALFTGQPQVNRRQTHTTQGDTHYVKYGATTIVADEKTGTLNVEDMTSEPMNSEDMTAEDMEAEPLVAEQLVDPDQVEDLSSGVIPEPMHVNRTYNSWTGKISRKEIKRGFIMAQVLGKPRALDPYKGQ